MSETRAGIIGLDHDAAVIHLPCMRRTCGLQIVACCDTNEHHRETARQLLGNEVRLHADYREMLAAGGLDVVYVLTPPAEMVRIVPDVVALGLPVFCEKHLDATSQQTREMAEAIRGAGVPHMVGMNRRFGPFAGRMREWLRTAGVPTRVEVICHRVWMYSPAASLGPGIHAVDLMTVLAGPVRRVTALHGGPRGNGFGAFVAAIEFASGAIGSFVLDNRMVVPTEEYHFGIVSQDTLTVERLSLTIPNASRSQQMPTATRRKMVYRDWVDNLPVWEEEKEEYARPDLAGRDGLVAAGYMDMHETFVRNLRAGVPLGPRFDEVMHAMAVAEAIQAGQSREFGQVTP